MDEEEIAFRWFIDVTTEMNTRGGKHFGENDKFTLGHELKVLLNI